MLGKETIFFLGFNSKQVLTFTKDAQLRSDVII